MINEVWNSITLLRHYIEKEEFKGYDPYDTLSSSIDFLRFGNLISLLLMQIQKRNPINIRPILGIKKDYNPKAIGLLLNAYSLLYQLNQDENTKKTMDILFHWLCDNYSKGYSGYAWGYNFDWVSSVKKVKAFTPSIVVTGFIGKGIFKYYQVTGDEQAKDVLISSEFILNDLPRTENSDGLCFSYTPVIQDCCYNASMLGAELLSMVYFLTGDKKYQTLAQQSVDFVLSYQKDDGRWNYSIDLQTNKERKQIDFHQGFILDSLYGFLKYSGLKNEKYEIALKKGAEFYLKEQFFANGQAKWRLPKVWPVEIHNQAQGIITFSLIASMDERYRNFARTIAEWTIENMQDKSGYFYYRKNKYFMNRISYMRWSQAWMMLALLTLLANFKK